MQDPFLPAEWAPQSATMLTWPHPHGDWAPWLKSVEPVFCKIAYHITQRQKLIISCYDNLHLAHVKNQLKEKGCDLNQVQLYVVPSNDSWARDHGPITVIQNGRPCLLDFQFNGWGKKYESRQDNAITQALHRSNAFGNTIIKNLDLVLEGGGIESDGQGTLLTSQCLLTPTRNPLLDKQGIEQTLAETLGIKHFLWLNNGHLQGDDTDGHIDTLARFCDENTICYVSCDNPGDPHYNALQAMRKELAAFRTQKGQAYRLIPLPMAKAIYNEDGIRLPATYANFLIINNAILAPVYDDARHDDIAIRTLAECFPDRDIIAINCVPLVQQYGSLHCVTMQLPTGVLQ